MRVTSLVLAIIGGVLGIILGLVAMMVGGVAEELEEGSGQTVIWLGVSAIAAAVVGLIASGAHFAGWRTRLMSFVLLAAAVWHLVSISYFGILGFLLLTLAAIFAWFSRKHADESSDPADAAGSDPKATLHRLLEMKEEGLITSEEYEQKRRTLIDTL